jgi:predicted GH43/DUF377 family glycosyl hydrolase
MNRLLNICKLVFVIAVFAVSLSSQTNEFHDKMLPAPLDSGFRMDGYWVWCGSVIKGEDGKYHMFASRWPKPPGFGPYWLTNSEIVHAISDKREGPYKFNNVALPARGEQYWDGQMTHNPAIRKYKDRYLLYYTGTTYTGPRPGMDFRISETHPKKLEAHRQERIGLATSKSPYGPWKRLDKPILDVVPGAWDQYLTSNAAPVVMKDGRVMLYYKGVTRLTVHAIGLAIADRFDKPYKRVSNEPLNMGIGAEDPFIWVENGKFKALMLDHERKYSPDKEIFYATSDNGLQWTTPPNAIAVSRNVKMADGSTQRFGKTERPHVLIENGRPTTVFFAVSGTLNGQGASWNVAVPLKK